MTLPGRFASQGAQLAVVGVAHVGKTLFPLEHRSDQGVAEHQVDVVGDEHQRA